MENRMITEPINIVDAMMSLRPSSDWVIRGGEITWEDDNSSQPTDDELQQEITRLTSERTNNQYQRDRKAEYPPIEDYLDGIVKDDQAQIDKYLADCQAVKTKFPKGE
jgi:hypothetical protein